MKTRQKTVVLGVVLLVLSVIIGSRFVTSRQAYRVQNAPVSLRLATNPETIGGETKLIFEVVNNTGSTFVCPDGWFIEFQDGSVTNLSLQSDLQVEPGKTGHVAIPFIFKRGKSRLGASYYMEDLTFQVKVQAAQSPLKNHLPAGSTAIQGKVVYSDWMNTQF